MWGEACQQVDQHQAIDWSKTKLEPEGGRINFQEVYVIARVHCGVRRISVSSTTQCRRSALSPFGECDNIGISSIFSAVFESFRGSRAYEKADVPFLACTEALRDNNSWQNLDDLLKPWHMEGSDNSTAVCLTNKHLRTSQIRVGKRRLRRDWCHTTTARGRHEEEKIGQKHSSLDSTIEEIFENLEG